MYYFDMYFKTMYGGSYRSENLKTNDFLQFLVRFGGRGAIVYAGISIDNTPISTSFEMEL